MRTVSSATLVVIFFSGCAAIEAEPERSIAQQLRSNAATFDVVHGTAREGPDCTHNLQRIDACKRIGTVLVDIDWAPDGLMVPADAPIIADYLIDEPRAGLGTGYVFLKRYSGSENEDVTITCGESQIERGAAHVFSRVGISDAAVEESRESHETIRDAVQEGTKARANAQEILVIDGCAGTEVVEE